MKAKVNATIVSLLTAVAVPTICPAEIRWSWSFDQTEFHVWPHESIQVNATIYNDPNSDGSLELYGAASFGGDLQKLYDFTFGPPGEDYGIQFLGRSVAPGDAFPFVFGVLEPIGGYVPPGIYDADPAWIGAGGWNQPPENTFRVVVALEDPPGPVIVPEPATLPFVALVVSLLFGRRLVPAFGRWKQSRTERRGRAFGFQRVHRDPLHRERDTVPDSSRCRHEAD